MGSASIAQAHYGVLKDGTRVVTKVQRPGIADMMREDFVLLKKLAGMLAKSAEDDEDAETLDLTAILEELEKVTWEELDFWVEAEHTRLFHKLCIEDETAVSCPKIIDELSTECILTMTYVDGYSISHLDRLEQDGYCFAAAQIKKALEITVKLGGRGYVFWGGREGYETLLNTDVKLEQENIANLMRMAVEYGLSIGFTGDFLIEPKPKEPMKHQYDFDAATAIGFLRQYGLDKDFKLNIEANHATLAGHTFQHELRISAINGMLGSIDANQGDMLLGWDTDEFPFNVYDTTLAMYEVLKAGGINGGFNFDSKNRRPSNTYEVMFHAYILGMDTFALGLIKAVAMIEDGRIDAFVKQRYASYSDTEIGKKIRDRTATLAELADCASRMKKPACPGSGRQELLEQVMNEVLFS